MLACVNPTVVNQSLFVRYYSGEVAGRHVQLIFYLVNSRRRDSKYRKTRFMKISYKRHSSLIIQSQDIANQTIIHWGGAKCLCI